MLFITKKRTGSSLMSNVKEIVSKTCLIDTMEYKATIKNSIHKAAVKLWGNAVA